MPNQTSLGKVIAMTANSLRDVLAAHGFASTGPTVGVDAQCNDCGTVAACVALDDFDMFSGDPLGQFYVCPDCVPMRCGNPECTQHENRA